MKRSAPFIIMLVMVIARWAFEWVGPLEAMLVPGSALSTVKLRSLISYFLTYIGVGALLMGVLNFSRAHLNNVMKRKENWVFSAWALLCALIYGAYGMLKTQGDPLYDSIYQIVFTPAGATMYSLAAFYLASSAYRAFRVRNIEVVLMMVVALIVIFANIPLGNLIWSSEGPLGGFSGVRDWVLLTPTAAVTRAIAFGVIIGGISSIWRVVLGVEKRHLPQ